MKKRTISALAAVALALTTTAAFASSGPIMFGDNVQRTHENGITDTAIWTKEAFLGAGASGGISLAGSSTAIGDGNTMFYPVSAGSASNNFQSTASAPGYMTIWDMSQWKWDASTSQDEPTITHAISIPDVSNSSPVYYNGYAYLAAGGKFYKFDSNGEVGSPVDISSASPVFANQIVTYPLLATASQLGTPTDEIWVSSQNGWLYAIDPSTMTVVQHVYLGQRLDASASLVTATDGTAYIAVTAAYSSNNKSITANGNTYSSGTGFLFLINPRDGAITAPVPNPSGSAVSSVASPVSINETIPGDIMWNDIDGDTFFAVVNPNGSVSFKHQWDNIGDGQTSDFSESGFSSTYDQYIVPFTDGGTYGYATVNPKTFDVKQVSIAGSSGPIKAFGSPEISASGSLYLADVVGGIDQIIPTASGGYNTPSGSSTYLASQGSSAGTTLSTPSELMVGAKNGSDAPTLTLATSQGLELWGNGIQHGEDLTFAQSYTSTSATQFRSPLTLTPSNSNLPAPSVGNTNKIDFDMIVNGNTKMDDIGSVATYDTSGNPITGAITIPTSTLDSWLSSYESSYPSVWNSDGQNLAVIEAFPDKGDTFTYQFIGDTAAPGGGSATVTITFPAPSTTPTTSTFDPKLCVQSNGTSCSSEEPGPVGTYGGYLEYRNLWPGQNSIAEGVDYSAHNHVKYADPTLGTPIAYKIHLIPEQAITSAKAEPYTTYYTYQKNEGGYSFYQTPNWFNQYTVEFVNGTTSAQNIKIGAEMDTVGDVLYRKRYITSWSPEVIDTVCGLWGCSYEVSYTPNYGTEYLYRNSNITEKISPVALNIPKAATYWWDPTTATAQANVVNVQATPQQSFSGSDTPITPSGSSLLRSQPVWASYGPWKPSSVADTKVYEQVPETAGLPASNTPPSTTPENMLPGLRVTQAFLRQGYSRRIDSQTPSIRMHRCLAPSHFGRAAYRRS